jgi:hypothetical protein
VACEVRIPEQRLESVGRSVVDDHDPQQVSAIGLAGSISRRPHGCEASQKEKDAPFGALGSATYRRICVEWLWR